LIQNHSREQMEYFHRHFQSSSSSTLTSASISLSNENDINQNQARIDKEKNNVCNYPINSVESQPCAL
jgi:hypothetical protein